MTGQFAHRSNTRLFQPTYQATITTAFQLFPHSTIRLDELMQHSRDDLSSQKQRLRQKIRQDLTSIPAQSWHPYSAEICQQVYEQISTLHLATPTYIGVFAAYQNEVDLSALHHLLPNTSLVYPLCHSKGILSFHHVNDLKELTPGALKIPEPQPEHHPKVPISKINLFLCPGLAFGHDGSRLGHGGGYYDRALAKKSPHALVWGICLNQQLLPTVPHDTHDIPVNKIITELKVISTNTY